MRQDGDVLFAQEEPEAMLYQDDDTGYQSNQKNHYQVHRLGLAWLKTRGDRRVVVGVMDSGTGPVFDLTDNLWKNECEICNDGIDNDGR